MPASAVHEEAEPCVYVRLKSGASQRQTVTLGKRTADKVQITSGLKPGDIVFTKKPKDAK